MSEVRWEMVGDEIEALLLDGICHKRRWMETLRGTIRLCRATPVEWSQEAPTKPGWYWLWSDGRSTELVEVAMSNDSLRVYMSDGFSKILSAQWPGAWWLPATLPAPPAVTP